jgi:hypothetical protein
MIEYSHLVADLAAGEIRNADPGNQRIAATVPLEFYASNNIIDEDSMGLIDPVSTAENLYKAVQICKHHI